MCISWIVSPGVVNRYSLNPSVGGIIFFDLPAYTNQRINKQFNLEIWSIDGSQPANPTAFDIFTSVLGNEDYRWGIDYQLDTLAGINQSICAILPMLPYNFNSLPIGGVYAFLTDEYGNKITDEYGNFIIVT